CFFFKAEDGIRYFHVTGVQRVLFRSTPCHTADVRPCAWRDIQPAPRASCRRSSDGRLSGCRARSSTWPYWAASQRTRYHIHSRRSEERRVGKEYRSRREEVRKENKKA